MHKPILHPSYSTSATVDPPALPPALEERRHAIDVMGLDNGISARHVSYLDRRLELAALEPFQSIARLPLPRQVAFRLKMLAIFALQLLVVGLVVTMFRFHSESKRIADDFFTPPTTVRLVLWFVTATVLLVALYNMRNVFLLNWALLLLFTCAQCLCFVGLGVALDTDIVVVNCAFTVTCVVIMIALAGVRVKSASGEMNDVGLFSTFYAGVIAYAAVALVISALFLIYGRDFVTNQGFYSTLALQFVLMLWFAYDSAAMYKAVSSDEYTHGVIYLYTDLVLLLVSPVLLIFILLLNFGHGYLCPNCRTDCLTKKKPEEHQVQQPAANREMDRV